MEVAFRMSGFDVANSVFRLGDSMTLGNQEGPGRTRKDQEGPGRTRTRAQNKYQAPIWRFPEIGKPLVIIHLSIGMFHCSDHFMGDPPIYKNLHFDKHETCKREQEKHV